MTNTDMTQRPRGTRWCQIAIWLAIIAGIAMIIGLGGGATGILGPLVAFGAFGLGLPLFIISILTGLIGLALSKGTGGNASAAGTWGALLIGVIFMGASLSQRPNLEGVPSIHDISTDVSDPPLFVAIVPLRGEGANPAEYVDDGTAEQQLEAYPDIVTLQLAPSNADIFDQALGVVDELGWELVSADPEAGIIEATATTYWFSFKDDVVIRVRENEGMTEVDVRSKSRVGRGDMGANAARVRTFLQAMSKKSG